MKAIELDFRELQKQSEEVIKKRKLPLLGKPAFDAPEFSFPNDPDSVTSTQLGQLMLRFAAWRGYAQRLLGTVDTELTVLEAEYKLKVGVEGLKVRKEMEGRPSADTVEAAVLERNEELAPLYERRLKLLAARTQLTARLVVYEGLYQALSRELSRRELEARIQ